MSIAAAIGALTVGLSLGLLGSGGSILTVPALLYLVGEPREVVVPESLAIVGSIAFVGSLPYAKRGLVSWRTVLLFGGPAMLGAYLGATLTALPFVTPGLQLVVFALVMLTAAAMMLRSQRRKTDPASRHGEAGELPRASFKLAIDGLAGGALTGFVGVGGGFLIVPALVFLSGLTMHRAIATSLTIIALNAMVSFLKYLDLLGEGQMQWDVITVFAGFGIIGSLVGSRIAPRVPQARLKQIFALVLVVIGAWMLVDSISAYRGEIPSQKGEALTPNSEAERSR